MSDLQQEIQATETLGGVASTRAMAALEMAEKNREKCEKCGRKIAERIAELRQVVAQDFARGQSIEGSWARLLSTAQTNELASRRILARKIFFRQLALIYYLYRWRALKAAAVIAVLTTLYIFWPEIVRAAEYIWSLIDELQRRTFDATAQPSFGDGRPGSSGENPLNAKSKGTK